MNRTVGSLVALVLTTALLAGCRQQTASHPDLLPLRAKFLLASEPAGAKDVLEFRATLDEQQKKSESQKPTAGAADAAKDDHDHDKSHDQDAHDHDAHDDAAHDDAAHDDAAHDHDAHDHDGHHDEADHDHEHHAHAAHEGLEMVVVGKIGGVDNPWDQGRAAFMLNDASAEPAAHDEHDHAEGDHAHDAAEHDDAHAHHGHAHGEHEDCPFCERAKGGTKSLAIVQFVGEDGKIVSIDSRQLFGVDKDQTVVVRGHANLDELGNMVITADGLYIRK